MITEVRNVPAKAHSVEVHGWNAIMFKLVDVRWGDAMRLQLERLSANDPVPLTLQGRPQLVNPDPEAWWT